MKATMRKSPRLQLVIQETLIEHFENGSMRHWRAATEDDCPSQVREEIAREIAREKFGYVFIANDGRLFRW